MQLGLLYTVSLPYDYETVAHGSLVYNLLSSLASNAFYHLVILEKLWLVDYYQRRRLQVTEAGTTVVNWKILT